MEEVTEIGFATQKAWMRGNLTRFEVIDHFVDKLLADESDESLQQVLPNLQILVTTTQDGFEVKQPTDRAELRELLTKTTWMYVFLIFLDRSSILCLCSC